MADTNITDLSKRKRQNYNAKFSRYTTTKHDEVFAEFTDVRDSRDNLLKPTLSINVRDISNMIGKMSPDEKRYFSAEIVMGSDFLEGFTFINILFDENK